jgi:hypothetical protein
LQPAFRGKTSSFYDAKKIEKYLKKYLDIKKESSYFASALKSRFFRKIKIA